MPVFTEAEQRAWSPAEKLTPSEWAERNRVLPSSTSPEPGKYRLERTPYAKGILDAATEVGVEEIVMLKSSQIGFSTICENILGYWIDADPGPCLYVLPSQTKAEQVLSERIRPFINSSDAIKRHITGIKGDDTKIGINFDSMPVHMAWSGSATSLASRSVRYCIFDEVDKFEDNAGREGDPISLGKERTKNFKHRRKVLILSTPVTRDRIIYRAFESCGDKRRFYVPCPHCRHYQTLLFPQVKKPKEEELRKRLNKPAGAELTKQEEADIIKQKSLAWYECINCQARIEESHKRRMIAAGVWVSDGQTIQNDGTITGKKPESRRVGFWINALYSPWTSFSDFMAEFLESNGNEGKMQNFRNSWCSEPFEERIRAVSVESLRATFDIDKKKGNLPPARVIPKWASVVMTGSDIMGHTMYWSTRAVGANAKSQLIDYGICTSFADLVRQGLDTSYPIEGNDGVMFPQRMLIDEGYRRDEVLGLCQRDERCIAVKGQQSQASVVIQSKANNHLGVTLYLVDTTLFKDRIANQRDVEGQWMLNADTSDEYLRHLAAEHKVLIDGKMVWQQVSEGAQNHWLDCEVYLQAAIEIFSLRNLPTEAELEQQRAAQARLRQAASEPVTRKPQASWIGGTSNWIRG